MKKTDRDHYAISLAIIAAGFLLWVIGAVGSLLQYLSDGTVQRFYVTGFTIALIGLIVCIFASGRNNKNDQ